MKKILILAASALALSAATIAFDSGKKNTKAKKENCTKGKSCSKAKDKTANI